MKTSILCMVAVLMLGTVMLAQTDKSEPAVTETVYGTIQALDVEGGSITVVATDGTESTCKLTSETKVFVDGMESGAADLKVEQRVTIELKDGVAISINARDAV